MATSANACGNIRLNFYWTGERELCGGLSKGGYDVCELKLKFNEDQNVQYVVSLPEEGLFNRTAIKLPFTLIHDRGEIRMPLTGLRVRNVNRQTLDALEIPVEKIRHLTIKAGILQISPDAGPTIMDVSGTLTQEMRAFKTYEEIELAIPTELKENGTYGVIFGSTSTAGSYSFSASFQEEKPSGC